MQKAPSTSWSGQGYLNAIQPKIQNFIAEHRSRFRTDQYDTVWLDV